MKPHPASGLRRLGVALPLLCSLCLGGCGDQVTAPIRPPLRQAPATSRAALAPSPQQRSLVPAPASVRWDPGADFGLGAATRILVWPATAEVQRIAWMLAGRLRPPTGFALPVVPQPLGAAGSGDSIRLELRGDQALGPEGYELRVTGAGVHIIAEAPAGLFHGVETLRQLLPPTIETSSRVIGPWPIPGGRIVDEPRYPWRGTMLDVARHFFPPEVVERYIDEIALYKLNVLHLHLSDDQGWRIAINGWPQLTSYGGSTAVGGGTGGYYSQQQYAEIVAYAQMRYVTIVPEIDLPGHVNAALASYPELNCDGIAPRLYTGENVGFSSLCPGRPITDRFISDVIGQVARITPGGYIHIGGDEARQTSASDYRRFMARAQQLVVAQGKRAVGWAEMATARLDPSTVAQYWNNDGGVSARAAAAQGAEVILSPAERAYLDQKYNAQTEIGLSWAGFTGVEDAYNWDPHGQPDVPAGQVLGVEAPLWSETVRTLPEIEYMAFPRLPGIAEIGWTPGRLPDWQAFRQRLAHQAPRWTAMGLHFYASPEVAWER